MNRVALLFLSLVGYASHAQSEAGVLLHDSAAAQIPVANVRNDAQGAEKRIREVVSEDENKAREFAVIPVPFNSSAMDFSPFPYGDGIVFVSSRNEKGKLDGEAEEFLNLYYTEEREDGTFSTPTLLNNENRTPYHEGPTVFFDHGKRKIFTRNAFTKKAQLKDDSVNTLQLVQAEWIGKKWTAPMSLPFNGPDFSVAHPAISADGKTLYFSSNMPGTLGEADLFVSRLEAGSWSVPKNLGPLINTSGHELFPYLHNDSILYFSSTRPGGLGGLDVYSCNLRNSELTIKHLGAPINSSGDDFGIILDNRSTSGFFSSNRTGNDDIFYFEEIQRFVALELYDSLTFEYVKDAKLTLRDGNPVVGVAVSDLTGRAEFRVSDLRNYLLEATHPRYKTKSFQFTPAHPHGAIKIYLAPIAVNAARELRPVQTRERTSLTNSVTFSSAPLDVDVVEAVADPTENGAEGDSFAVPKLKVIAVENVNAMPAIMVIRNDSIYDFSPVSPSILENQGLKIRINMPQGAKRHDYEEIISADIRAQGYEVGKFLLIRSFFFDSEKTLVRNDASAQLDKIIEIMAAYPQIDVKLVFHSDSRGTDKFNLELSKRRAEEVTKYLRQAGIASRRIVSQFVGESKLLNDCGDLSDCDELLHQMNRTTEFELVLKKDQL